MDWLLHIDADEIFHLPAKDGTAPEHFSRLDQLGLNQAVYLNKEAVYPDANLEPARAHKNLFAATVSFKNNPLLFDRQKLDIMHEWRDNHLKYFMSYSNGKVLDIVGSIGNSQHDQAGLVPRWLTGAACCDNASSAEGPILRPAGIIFNSPTRIQATHV